MHRHMDTHMDRHMDMEMVGSVRRQVTIIVLALGNIAAIDFQARVLAAKDGDTARKGCFIAAAMVFLIGGFTSANGGAIRAL